jgi:hypothetical protein
MKRWVLLAAALSSAGQAGQRKKPTVSPPPIVRVQSPAPLDEKYGLWTVSSRGGDGFLATIRNDAGSVFGMLCNNGDCVPFFNPAIACDPGYSYPALINAPSAAAAVIVKCTKYGDVKVLVLPESKPIIDAMTIGGELGIAFPMQSGQFAVSRFSLTGSLKASLRAQELSEPTKKPAAVPKDDITL